MIKDLTPKEVNELRKKVEDQFKKRPFTGAGIKANQYKLSYEEIRKDIIEVVPGSELSVSLTRLRKLFFYTNPEFCPEDKLVKPSFGDDFIRVLLTYVEELPDPPVAPLQPPTSQLHFRWWKYVAALLTLVLLLSGYCYWSSAQPRYWKEDFDDTSVAGLKSRGWEILDYDSLAFSRQLKPGDLTLYTLNGDYWYAPPDTPRINNLLLKRIPGGVGKITCKIDSLNPLENYQQVCVFFMNKHKSKSDWFRISFTATVLDTTVYQMIQIVKMERNTAYEKEYITTHAPLSKANEIVPKLPMWLQVQFHQGTFDAFYHNGLEHSSFFEIDKINFDFEPYYVAVCAFRGLRDMTGQVNKNPSIPAFINYIRFEPL